MTRHRVGVDARYLIHHAVGGYQTYVQQLMAAFNRVQTDVEVWAILSADSQQVDAIDRLERTVLPISVPYLGIAWREQVSLTRRAAEIDLDLLHYPCNTMALRPWQLSVVTVHDLLGLKSRRRPAGWRNRMTASYERAGLRAALSRATLFITPSRAGELGLVEAGVEAERVRVIPEGVSPAFLAPIDSEAARHLRSRHGLDGSYLVTFASDDPRKNVPAVIDALALLNHHPRVRLAIVMSSEGLQRELVDKVRSRGLQQRVSFVPRLSGPEVAMLFSGAVATVFPSLAEGFGLPPLESMACGTPVVCSNRPPLDELYGQASLLVNPLDPADVARQLDRVLTQPDLQSELVTRGRELVSERTWEAVALQTAQAYLEAIELGPTATARQLRRRRAA